MCARFSYASLLQFTLVKTGKPPHFLIVREWFTHHGTPAAVRFLATLSPFCRRQFAGKEKGHAESRDKLLYDNTQSETRGCHAHTCSPHPCCAKVGGGGGHRGQVIRSCAVGREFANTEITQSQLFITVRRRLSINSVIKDVPFQGQRTLAALRGMRLHPLSLS